MFLHFQRCLEALGAFSTLHIFDVTIVANKKKRFYMILDVNNKVMLILIFDCTRITGTECFQKGLIRLHICWLQLSRIFSDRSSDKTLPWWESVKSTQILLKYNIFFMSLQKHKPLFAPDTKVAASLSFQPCCALNRRLFVSKTFAGFSPWKITCFYLTCKTHLSMLLMLLNNQVFFIVLLKTE